MNLDLSQCLYKEVHCSSLELSNASKFFQSLYYFSREANTTMAFLDSIKPFVAHGFQPIDSFAWINNQKLSDQILTLF
jgi:hypothetical protein